MPEPRDDEDLEHFLRQFEPRPPSALLRHRRSPTRALWALAAASLAVALIWVGSLDRTGSTVHAPERHEPSPGLAAASPRSRPTVAELSVVLRPVESARVAEDLESHVLSDPRRRGGALRDIASAEPGH